MTFLDLIKSSLRLIGQLGPGRGPNTSETVDATFVLNAMLEAWSTQRLAIYHIARTEHTLDGSSSYTIGPLGDFDQARPVRVENAALVTGTTEAPIPVLSTQRWLANRDGVYLDNAYPLSALYVNPATTTGTLVLYSWEQLTSVTDVDDDVVFPPGYADALRYNLAVRLAPEWGKEIRPDVMQLAVDSLASIKALNTPDLEMGIDAALVSRRGFNILTGE